MFGSFLRHYFRIPRWSCCCLATVCALLVSTISFADIVNIPTGPFEGQVVLTNLVFADWDEYYSYKQTALNMLSEMESMYVICTSRVESVEISISYISNRRTSALLYFRTWSTTDSGLAVGNNIARQGISEVEAMSGDLQNARNSVTDMKTSLQTVGADLATTRTALETDSTEYRGTFATSAGDDSSSGGCQCPDYTTILQTIQSNLYDTMNMVRSIRNYCDTIDSNLDTILWDYIDVVFTDLEDYFLYPYYDIITGLDDILHIGSGAGASGNYRSLGQGLGYVFRTNALASALSYALTGQIEDQLSKSIWQSSLSPGGSSIATAIAEALNPIRRMFSWDATDHTAGYSPTERQILNFLWTRNVHPTNTFANPLYVTNTSPMTLEITPDSAGSSEHPINVSVGNPEVIINQDGVTVTNRLALNVSIEGFSGDDGEALNVKVVNFDDLRDILDNYFNSSSAQEDAEEEKEDENDDSEEELDDSLDASGSDPQFFVSLDPFHNAATKYRQMLVSLRQLIPETTSPPRFYFDYSFQFSGASSGEPTRSGTIEATPIGPDTEQASQLGRYLQVVRGFCSAVWLGVVLATGLWLLKWAIRGLAFATALAMTIASGDLASVARLLPGFVKTLLSMGDA